MKTDVIIPALNEAQSIRNVIRSIPPWVRTVYVVDNGSTDDTAAIAADHGAVVVHQPRRGYGAACLAGLSRLAMDPPDIVVFMDADGSDRPEEMESLIAPIVADEAALVIGSRVLNPATAQPGSLSTPQRFGNALATFLIRRLWKVPCTDLGPFRAIRYSALCELAMDDLDYGWTVQMQARAAKRRMRMVETPVSYRTRIGRSKISGTVRGVLGAGTKILSTIAREGLQHSGTRCAVKRARLIIFSRVPKPGTTKTRLIPTLGEEGAAQLQTDMMRHTLMIASEWSRSHGSGAEIEVRYTGGTTEEMIEHFGTHQTVQHVEQSSGDLGDRMADAFTDAFADGVDHAIAIGCDCPELTADLIRKTSKRLRNHDVAIGPANDGGYYLIGINKPRPALFREIEWGSARVCAQTLQRASETGLSVAKLPELSDVDEPEDIAHWIEVANRSAQPIVSIIIPTLNEAERLRATITAARQSQHVEIIVVDGGSCDGTTNVATSLNARVLTCPCKSRGRALQMNYGARYAEADVLLFLHADTCLPFGYLDDVQRIHHSTDVVGLSFRLAFDTVSLSLRMIERGANLRSRWRSLPYGDQALVIRRDIFNALGGFKNMPIMEDYAFIRRLRNHGTVLISRRTAITSARRWMNNGIWQTTLSHQIAITAYAMGVSTDWITQFLGRKPTNVHKPVFTQPNQIKEESAYASASKR